MSDSSNPMDCSLPGSSIHGIFQARVLEWGAIAFSGDFIWQQEKGIEEMRVFLSSNFQSFCRILSRSHLLMRGMAKKREDGNSWSQHFKTVLRLEVTFLEEDSKNWLEKG